MTKRAMSKRERQAWKRETRQALRRPDDAWLTRPVSFGPASRVNRALTQLRR